MCYPFPFFLVFAIISKCFCISCSYRLVSILHILLSTECWGTYLSPRDRAQPTTIKKYVMKAFYKSYSSQDVDWIRSVERWSYPKKVHLSSSISDFIREVAGSKLGRDDFYPDMFMVFIISSSHMLRPQSSVFFPIRYSLSSIQSFSALW